MAEEVKRDPPEVLATLREMLAEKGWSLAHADAKQGVYRAERQGAELAASSAAGLVVSVNDHEDREARTSLEFLGGGPMIITGPVDVEQEEDTK